MANRSPSNKDRSTDRPKRTPVGGRRDILTVAGKDPNYVYRWFNDEGDRIIQALNGGYHVVTNEGDEIHEIGDLKASDTEGVGTPIVKSVGKDAYGNPMYAYLMRIPREWYEEDQAEKQKEVDASEESIFNPDDSLGQYGGVRVDRKLG